MPHFAKPITVMLEYTDADGIETRRTVDVYRTAKKSGNTTITGWCHGRQAERTFRSDRIAAVIDEHGEVMSAQEFLANTTKRRKPAAMMEAESLDVAPSPNAPQRRRATGRAWGNAIFLIALAPGIMIALGFAFGEENIPFALTALVILCLPVVVLRWIIVRIFRKNQH